MGKANEGSPKHVKNATYKSKETKETNGQTITNVKCKYKKILNVNPIHSGRALIAIQALSLASLQACH